MAKFTHKTFTPEESKKMFGGKHLIIVGGGIGRRSGKPSNVSPEEIEQSKKHLEERKRFLARLEKDLEEQFGIRKQKDEKQSKEFLAAVRQLEREGQEALGVQLDFGTIACEDNRLR